MRFFPGRTHKNKTADIMEYPYVWGSDARPAGRKGQVCKKVGKDNGQPVIQFADGHQFVVDEKGLVRRTPIHG